MGVCPHRGEGGAGFAFFGMGALRWDGRDARGVQPGNGAIFAGFCKFKLDEPENEANLARSVVMQSKHARDKSRGLRQRFNRAFGVVRAFVRQDLIVCPRAGEEKQRVSGCCFT